MKIAGIPYVQGRWAYTDRDGHKYGIAIHCTANDATAEQEASYASRRDDGVSAHFFVDNDSIVQSLDTNDRAGHAGSYEGNEHAIAIEITGTTGKSRSWWLANVAWDRLARVLATLCQHYDIEPRHASVSEMRSNPKVRAFYSHDDMRQAWAGTTHTDPGPNFPWDHLLATVKQAMEGDDMPTVAEIATAVWSRNLPSEAAGITTWATGDWLKRGEIAVREVRDVRREVAALRAEVATLAGRDLTDESAIVTGVLAGLSPEAIAAAIPADLAQRVAGELATRLAG